MFGGRLWHTILRKENKKKGTYLQMYESHWDKEKKQSMGIFLICYLSLFLLRVLEIKVFKNQINSYDLIDFIRDFRVVNKGDGSYINISRNQTVNEKVKKATGLTNLDALFLTEKEINNLFQNCILLDS